MKLKITKLDKATIRIEYAINAEILIRKCYAAQFYANGNENTGNITVRTDKRPFFEASAGFNETEINGVTPASVEDAVRLLNDFIGNFAHGGAEINSENLQEALGNALVETFDPDFETEEI